MQQTLIRHVPAINDNLPDDFAAEMLAALTDLRDFSIPAENQSSPAGLAFSVFRRELIAGEAKTGTGGQRDPRGRRNIHQAATTLELVPCESANDLVMKALAFRALATTSIAYAASRRDLRGMIADADAMASFLCGVAGDALVIASRVGLQ